eukprot:TRINITY_DN2684_c0_g1_i3.p1 TRINITY_DN2684_c0_g1~~TRINITY_DN2684_c0_g1_i3.p1  ORF type:complete len:154 (+),score=17.93 TRINITY_DN2684_c0_g1_i3:461-922(+)
MADQLRRNMFQCNILVGGYDKEKGSSLYYLDYLATLQKLDKAAYGYGGYPLLTVMDANWKKVRAVPRVGHEPGRRQGTGKEVHRRSSKALHHLHSKYYSEVHCRQWSEYSCTLTFIPFRPNTCLLYTSDAADDMQCVDLGGRRIIKKKKKQQQ